MPKDDTERDLSKLFDLDRTSLTKEFVNRLEEVMRQSEAARDDLKAIVAECVAAEFRKHDIAAMKKIAKLRLADKAAEARDHLAALERVGRAVGFDLFDWSDRQGEQ